jgi:hypothetical protein
MASLGQQSAIILDLSFKLGVFSKNVWAYQFVSVAITSTRFDVQNNSEYSRWLLGSSKPTFMPGMPVNGKCGHLAPDFAHLQCCMLLLSLTFS